MYITTCMNHRRLPDDLEAKSVFDGSAVALHLGDAYISLEPDEAERLGRLLLVGAAQARADRELYEAERETAKA